MEDKTIMKEAIFYIKQIVEDELNSSNVDERDNLIEEGLSSIQIMKISSKLKKFGLDLSFEKLMKNPTIEDWNKLIGFDGENDVKDLKKSNNPYEEFPLTDTQYAYFIGREDSQILGGVGCHTYLEMDGKNINTDKLKKAWDILKNKHTMLKARFNNNETQQIMEKPYPNEMGVYDFRLSEKSEEDEKLLELRNKLSNRKLKVEYGEVAGLNVALLSDDRHKIFLDVDLLAVDLRSLTVLIDELSKIYDDDLKISGSDFEFKDYLLNKQISDKLFNKDKEFWQGKIKDSLLLESCNLPLKKKPELIEKVIFSRRKKILDKMSWNKIKRNAKLNKITPSMVLLACYSMIIERWANQNKILINVPFDKSYENEITTNVIGNFTDLLLVECEIKDEIFINRARQLSNTFLENISHSSYSGIKVQRDICKEVGKSFNVAPVVFSCNIDYSLETEKSKKIFGDIVYMSSQTPQVWLNFQTYVIDEELILYWDAPEGLYPENMLDDMFDSLNDLLHSLTDNDNWYIKHDILPESQKEMREKELKDILPLQYPEKNLYTDFIKTVKIYFEKVAIIDAETGVTISYKDLYENSLKVASKLISKGVKNGDYVGITLPRGYKQIIGLLGILFSGAAYVPIGISQPKERRKKIYEQIKIDYVLSDEKTIKDLFLDMDSVNLVDIDKCENERSIEKPVEINNSDTAYVIMTSGTTGVPKGVEITHNSAINTINDINEKYKIGSKDSVIAVSAIDFDLSVYDIFGMLSVGGTVITLNEDNFKDPDLWIKLIERYDVSLWNSVPILFDMLITMAEGKDTFLPLKTVLLSGDWIPTTLPGRFYKRSKNSMVVGMGGATEASIWSNFINIPEEIPKDWISIPYGKALKNQVYRITDNLGRICPDYVRGELLIGGVGVAKGYRGDKELTSKKFIQKDNMKWYRTGDNGRTWNDGTIEFLGRLDNQVKVKGHRIELGEIEIAIERFKGVKNVIVDFIDIGNVKQLTAFVDFKNIPAYKEKSENPDTNEFVFINSESEVVNENKIFVINELMSYLRNSLPKYMIPMHYYELEGIPLNKNGKVDRKALRKKAEKALTVKKSAQVKEHDETAQSKDFKNTLADIWSEVLEVKHVDDHSNFFSLGGDSLKATVVISKLKMKYNVNLPMKIIFEKPILKDLSEEVGNIYNNS